MILLLWEMWIGFIEYSFILVIDLCAGVFLPLVILRDQAELHIQFNRDDAALCITFRILTKLMAGPLALLLSGSS